MTFILISPDRLNGRLERRDVINFFRRGDIFKTIKETATYYNDIREAEIVAQVDPIKANNYFIIECQLSIDKTLPIEQQLEDTTLKIHTLHRRNNIVQENLVVDATFIYSDFNFDKEDNYKNKHRSKLP